MRKVLSGALTLIACASAHADDVAGYVLSQQGLWTLRGTGTALRVGSAVPPGGQLAVANPGHGDHIVVVAARSGEVLASKTCTAAAASCSRPLEIARPSGTTLGGSIGALVSSVVARLAGNPDRYVATLSRGSVRLSDLILAADEGGGVDLDPLWSALPSADYRVRLVLLHCRPGQACMSEPLPAQLRSGQPPARMLLAPGLYDLVVDRSSDGPGPRRARCWLLVAPAAELAEVTGRYRAGLAVIAAWGADVDAETKQGFARALLAALAES